MPCSKVVASGLVRSMRQFLISMALTATVFRPNIDDTE